MAIYLTEEQERRLREIAKLAQQGQASMEAEFERAEKIGDYRYADEHAADIRETQDELLWTVLGLLGVA